jgi:long-chain acyl-CoA synthetase
MHPGDYSKARPDHPAVVMATSGETLTYSQLDARSNQLAHLFRDAGLEVGDHVAIFMENRTEYFEILWAAIRSGLYLTPINCYLTADEAAYILKDSEAQALVASAELGNVAIAAAARVGDCNLRLAVGGEIDGFDDYQVAMERFPTSPLSEQPLGDIMNYSSGTTGRPKGIRRSLTGASIDEPMRMTAMVGGLFGFDTDTVYLSTAPLYHMAPLGFCLASHTLGATVVCMEHFEPLDALAAIEHYRVTHSQWVPTMFVRMLKAPVDIRDRYDLSSMQFALHAAAPCPRPVKEQMLDWWGPIVHEYYSGTEGNGLTYVSPEDWLAHPGTVGRAMLGIIHVCDPDGKDVPAGVAGTVFFEQPTVGFEYHNDPEKTRSGQHPAHANWATLGDIGYVDKDGFLFLTDRQAFMIISGGVNIYPQEIEDCLVMHEVVADVAVIGVPDTEMGESVKAIVQLVAGVEPSEELAATLIAHCRANLAGYKVPRSIEFEAELPRLPTGKLYKQVLRARYWPQIQ